MPVELPKIYPITNVELSGLRHADQVRLLAEGGCRFAQIREKRLKGGDLFDAVVAAKAIADQFGMTLIVNDRVDIAMAVGAAGAHLGQEDLPPDYARSLLGNEAILGYSTHSVEQAVAAAAMSIDYIAIGPIFATSTKENPDRVIGLEGVREVRESIGRFPLVAIGGIGRDNLREVLSAGADSAAMISELYRDANNSADRYAELSDLASGV